MRRLLLLSLILVSGACHRAARPDVSVPREAFAGEPVRLVASGAEEPGPVWFIDDRQVAQGASVEHSFHTAGVHRVRAELDGDTLHVEELTVLPRPVLRAIPAQVAQVTWIPHVQRALEPAVDFLERATPSFSAAADEDPFLRYALELSAGPPPPELGLDPEEGLAAFRLHEVPGSIVTIGVQDDAAALRSVRRAFVQRGYTATEASGVIALGHREGRTAFAFTDRGYLYLLMSEGAESFAALDRVRDVVRASPAEGLSGDQTLGRLRERVMAGQVYVLLRPRRSAGEGPRIEGALTSLQFASEVLAIDGFVLADGPLWNVTSAPAGSPLEGGAHGPVLAASLSVAPEELAKLLRGGLDGDDDAELAQLERAFTGTVGLTAYLDARGTLDRLGKNPGAPDVSGTLLAHVGVRDRPLAESLVERALRQRGLTYEKRPATDATAFLFELRGRRAVVEVTEDRLNLEAGEPLRDREGGRLLQQLQERYGAQTFGPGHASLLIDLGQVLRELSQAQAGGGKAAAMTGLARSFLQQLTAVDTVFVDVQPVDEGARLKGRVTLRPR
ncbi:MAG: hypothetical protein WBV82_15160 [Myxococcaceae bacterium]